MADLTAQIVAAGGELTESDIRKGVLTGHMRADTADDLVQLNQRMQGRDAGLIAAGYKRLEQALAQP